LIDKRKDGFLFRDHTITGREITGKDGKSVRQQGSYSALAALTAFVEFNVPIQIIAPAHGSIPDAKPERDNRHPFRFGRMPDQTHSGLAGCSTAFLVVTRKTGRYDILPRGTTALDLRDNMVEGEFLGRIPVATVLAGVLVTLINIGTREADLPARAPDLYEFKETKNGRKSKGDGHTPHLAVVEVDDLHFPLREQCYGPLPRNDLERFERRIQEKCPFHGNHALHEHLIGSLQPLPVCAEKTIL
jgi:hypothetical protein